MARFRRPSSSKSASPSRPLKSPFSTSRLEAPSSKQDQGLRTPLSSTDRDRSPFLSLLGLWPNRSGSVVSLNSASEGSEGAKSNLPFNQPFSGQSSGSFIDDEVSPRTTSPRLPRHIPIIIPGFANPHDPYLRLVASEGALSSSSNQSTPHLRREARVIPSSRYQLESCSLKSPASRPKADDNLLTTMNSSQVSLVTSEASTDGGHTSQPGAGHPGHVGISPVSNQQNGGPTHLSGLVCSVHRTTGQRPHALVGATTTILGDKLFVFGGRLHSRTKPQLTCDLYQLDLIKRHWTKVETLGDVPAPRYFHSVCALGDSKLVCYGGMSPQKQPITPPTNPNAKPLPEVVVMSDIHVFDVPTRTWTLILTNEKPEGRYAHCAAILPSSAVFTSASAPLSAIQHNPSSSDPHSGKLGVELDGSGGAEMVVVGGQDRDNNYIEQINVFNLRSLKWTGRSTWDRKCGAYKSMVVPMTGLSADLMGQEVSLNDYQAQHKSAIPGTPMLIYSNYNFLDVKLELQIRLPNGSLVEKTMAGPVSPPGLRFPNGGILDNHFVVSGTYLTSSKHEYALWALDLKTLTWGRIDTNVSIFEQGSWNRGVLWNRRNTFVILGHQERSLVDDYNHRRINFTHVCMVELEAFGLYDSPRKTSATSGYVSISAPAIPPSVQNLSATDAGGRPYTSNAEKLGQAALNLHELSDMELIAIGGERIPCNSHILSRRWGPYFNQLLMESCTTHDNATILSEAATLRPLMQSQASRNSSITITPSVANGIGSGGMNTGNDGLLDPQRSMSRSTTRTMVELPNATSVPASSRPRSLYLPHMVQTIQLLLQFFYTSSLPPVGTPLCTPHTLCSLLQMARPYQVDGLLEATVERLHEVLDGRNAAAVFNAAAMAAGGGRGVAPHLTGPMGILDRRESEATTVGENTAGQTLAATAANLKVTTDTDKPNGVQKKGHGKSDSVDSTSTDTSASTGTDVSHTDTESMAESTDLGKGRAGADREVWTGDLSSVIGLQKRGLRGLMEGKRLRERANTVGSADERGV